MKGAQSMTTPHRIGMIGTRTMNALKESELIPIVTQILGQPAIDSLTWELQPLKVQGGRTTGVMGLVRLVGAAQAAGQMVSWSVVVKIIRQPDAANDPTGSAHIPTAWNFWQREILAYQSGILADLSEQLVAPRCYGVTAHADGEWRIWLEDVAESPKDWTLDRYGIAARHLGQFNGSYLAGRPLPPEQPWFYGGRSHEWVDFAATLVEPFRRYAATPQGRRGLSEQSVARIEGLLANAQRLLATLGRMPRCLCHHDAFRRNLMARDPGDAGLQTVAIDWSMLGYGQVGADIGILTALSLSWMEVAGEHARELDRIVFDGYVTGLRDAGWQGDPRLARFGYAATAALAIGVAGAVVPAALFWPNEESARDQEEIIGHHRDAIHDQQAIVQPFLLDLGDEALQLMDSLR